MQPPEGLQDQAVNFLLVRLGSTDLASGRCSNAMDMPGWQMESGPGHLRKQRRSQGRLLGGRGSRTEAGGRQSQQDSGREGGVLGRGPHRANCQHQQVSEPREASGTVEAV